MDGASSPEAYRIRNARIPILLALRPVTELNAHEETVPEDMERLVSILSRDPVLRHPIIVDKETGLVLDGTHRLAALTRVGCKFAPCALVDYNNPKIRVERWFRLIMGSRLKEFSSRLNGMRAERSDALAGEKCLAERQCFASLQDNQSCLTFRSTDPDPVRQALRAFEIEKIARNKGLNITYTDTKTLSPGTAEFIMSTIQLEKHEVVQSSLKHTLFPPKTTRHIIPSRPLGINTPIEWLREDEPRRAQTKFIQHLTSKKMTRLPEGSVVGSRRYQEEVFIFE